MRFTAATAFVLTLALCAQADAAWHQPVGGTSPINHSPDGYAEGPSLIEIEGVPYVGWDEYDGQNAQIRVARLTADGTDWEELGAQLNPGSPINQSPTRQAYNASLTAVGGVPYVAWNEADSLGSKIRVARLNAAGTGWDKVGQTLNQGSPINQAANREATDPSLTTIDGVPYVAWEETDNTNDEIRVARLNASGTGWDKVGQTANPASPINVSSTQAARTPSLTSIAGVPYVAWQEYDGTNYEIRVARLKADGTDWEEVGAQLQPGSPINEANGLDASEPSLTAIDGVPYVAWTEKDGVNAEVRVARLNAAGTGWEKVGESASPASPINASASSNAEDASLTSIGGSPWVAWDEDLGAGEEVRVARLSADGTSWERVADAPSPINDTPGSTDGDPSITAIAGVPFVAWGENANHSVGQTRVSRLEPEFLSQAAIPGATTATLSATWHTYGLSYGLGFDYGTNLEQSTTPAAAPFGQETVTVEQQATGLSPSTAYSARPFATAGSAAPRVLGETASFATTAAPDMTPPETTITKEPKNKSKKSKAKYKFTSSEPNSTFVCKFDKKKPKPCDAGKFKAKHLDDGKHKFRVYAVDAAGNADPSPAKDKFKVL